MTAALLLAWLALAPVQAQTLPDPDLAPSGPALQEGPEVDDRVRLLSEGMRCPTCQGLSVADSQAESAVAMRHRVEEMVMAGYDDGQITAWFVDRYGEWILLEPPARGLAWLVWAGPGVLLLAGAAFLVYRLGRTPAATSGPGLASEWPRDLEPYVKRTLEELGEA